MIFTLFLSLCLDTAELATIPPKDQCRAMLDAAWLYEAAVTQDFASFPTAEHEARLEWARHRRHLWQAAWNAWEIGNEDEALACAREFLRLVKRGGP